MSIPRIRNNSLTGTLKTIADTRGSNNGSHSSREYSGVAEQANIVKGGKTQEIVTVLLSSTTAKEKRRANRKEKEKEERERRTGAKLIVGSNVLD